MSNGVKTTLVSNFSNACISYYKFPLGMRDPFFNNIFAQCAAKRFFIDCVSKGRAENVKHAKR